RLALDELDVDRPAAPVVEIELVLAAPLAAVVTKPGEPLRQLETIVYPAVQSQPADRVVHVRGIAGKQHAALAERRGDALMHLVQAAVHERIRRRLRKEPLKTLLRSRFGERTFVAFLATRGKDHAPLTLAVVACDLEEIGPLLGIGQVVAIAVAALTLEIELRR